MNTADLNDIPVFVPLDDEEEEVTDLIELFAAMQGYTIDQYSVVHPGEKETYEEYVAALREEGVLQDVDERSWLLSFHPDKDPTIDIGEASLPKLLRIIRVIPLH